MSKWYKYLPDVGKNLGKSVEQKLVPERFKSIIAKTPVLNDIVSRGWLGPAVQQFTPEGQDAYSNSKTSEYLQKGQSAAILAALAFMGGGAIAGTGGAGAGAGGLSGGGSQVATVMGNPVTYGQTAQGAGMFMNPGGIMGSSAGMGAPVAVVGGSPVYGSQTYAGSSSSFGNPTKNSQRMRIPSSQQNQQQQQQSTLYPKKEMPILAEEDENKILEEAMLAFLKDKYGGNYISEV